MSGHGPYQPFSEWMEAEVFWTTATWDEEHQRMWVPGRMVLVPDQKTILDWCLAFDGDGNFHYQTIILSMIKKSGKTALAAAIIVWLVEKVFLPNSEVFVMANDQESAEARVFADVKFHYEGTGRGHYVQRDDLIKLPNGTTIQAMPQHYRSAAGSRHALTVWDELWGFTSEASRRMFGEMVPINTVPVSLRLIVTYAGFENESDLLWDLYLKGVDKNEYPRGKGQGERIAALNPLPCYENPRARLFVLWDHERRMPWQQDDSHYDAIMETARPSEFIRHYMNQWVSNEEEFIPIEWWDRATKVWDSPIDLWEGHPYRPWPLSLGVDVAPKHDCSAVVGTAYDAGRGKLILAFHRIWTPSKKEVFDLEATVESYLMDVYTRFNVTEIVYDPTQLHRSMTTLGNAGLPVREFPQTVPNMQAASQLLYDLLNHSRLEAYPDDELRSHIRMAVAESRGRGFRIVKDRASAHVDGAVALAMSCLASVNNSGVDTREPVRWESPFSDVSRWRAPSAEDKLPFPLRDDREDNE